MLFNSLDFAVFLPIVFVLYWFVFKPRKQQNMLLLVASYVFYGSWDPRFLSLIVISSIIDYWVGLKLAREEKAAIRKRLLAISFVANLGMLAFFKYFNFFIEGFTDTFSFFGLSMASSQLNIILPVGISFYTFQTLSYSIDIYRKKFEPTQDVISFFAFVSFFPQLVAGPIERANRLLPQFHHDRSFNQANATSGMRQILWGLFKKVVIADSCGVLVDAIFQDHQQLTGGILILGAVLFAFQIYGDFSGYSDIAIGIARLFGFDLMRNFANPYFSRNVAEFWRRWHISLSTWFRDYLYIPLGGSKGSVSRQLRNVFIIFIISGFWHGANWTFIAWGAIHALYFIPTMLIGRNRKYLSVVAESRAFPSLYELGQMLITFTLVTVAWVFFRSASINDAFSFLNNALQLHQLDSFTTDLLNYGKGYNVFLTFALLIVFIWFEWLGRSQEHTLEVLKHKPAVLRYSIYLVVWFCILFTGNYHSPQDFIYFQF